MQTPQVDKYLVDGCMRCKLGATPACKVTKWVPELETLRLLVLDSGLTEEIKWGVPCYTLNGKNVIMISAFKEYACISFLKGALLQDKHQLLVKQGEHGQAWRIVKYTDAKVVLKQAKVLKLYIAEAIAIEQMGKKVVLEKKPEPIPDELLQVFEEDAPLKNAFNSLTPGSQRGYILYFSQPKQAQTRLSRIEKCRDKILMGEGLNDKYSGKKKPA
jgi:uncharacterized protein YdeI (YjbR/CyaY-like superfamily)